MSDSSGISQCRQAGPLMAAITGTSLLSRFCEVHATPPRPLPGDTGEPGSAIRSVRPASGSKRPGRDGLAGAARGGSGSLTDLLARLFLEHEAGVRRAARGAAAVAMSADKIKPHHLARKAIV